MQQIISQLQTNKNGSSQAQPMIITAIILFALSGLIVGFTVGVFARAPKDVKQTIAQNPDIPVPKQTAPALPSPTTPAQPVKLGCPQITVSSYQAVADGQTPDSVTVQAKEKGSTNACTPEQEQSATANGITCRVWLVKRQDATSAQIDSYGSTLFLHLDQLSTPFPSEVPGLIFDPTTPQVQLCKQGQGQWKFTLSPTIGPGNYDLIALTDWQGLHYSYSWRDLTVGAR